MSHADPAPPDEIRIIPPDVQAHIGPDRAPYAFWVSRGHSCVWGIELVDKDGNRSWFDKYLVRRLEPKFAGGATNPKWSALGAASGQSAEPGEPYRSFSPR
jgi:hypothetical protein